MCGGRRALFVVFLGSACVNKVAEHKAAGNVLFRHGDIDGALREYAQAVKHSGKDPEAYVLYGNALFEKERYDDAQSAFSRTLELKPGATAAHRGLAKIALVSGHSKEAERHFKALLALDPLDHEALQDIGLLAASRGDLEQAEQWLERGQAVVRDNVRTLFALAVVRARRGKTQEALALAGEIERLAPKRGYADYARATAYALAGEVTRALDALTRTLEKGVDDISKVRSDPNLSLLTSHPRFQELLAATKK